MRRLLKHPATNAVCISLFSGFYAVLFIYTANSGTFSDGLSASGSGWLEGWGRFLKDGGQSHIANAMIVLTIVLLCMLLFRKKPFDEYQTSILANSLMVAVVLTTAAMALMVLVAVTNPVMLLEKMMLFAAIHWVTVVICDMVYVWLCRWR